MLVDCEAPVHCAVTGVLTSDPPLTACSSLSAPGVLGPAIRHPGPVSWALPSSGHAGQEAAPALSQQSSHEAWSQG